MGKLRLKPGVITGNQLQEVFEYCKTVPCALPAVNVVGSNTITAAMQSAKEAGAPIIIQFSNGGGHFNAGKFLDNTNERAAIAGSVAGAHHIRMLAEYYGVPVVLHTDHCALKIIKWVDGLLDFGEKYFKEHGEPLFSSHMLDLSEESLDENLRISRDYLERMAKMKMTLEIELGVTGGEEDGVDNTDVDSSRLYTQPEEVLQAYDTLNGVGDFTVAAAFGNTHGVYKPGNVKLRPVILKNSQQKIREDRNTSEKPLNLVFHGGSGSTQEEIKEAVSYGVIKMNIDTDTQWAFTRPIKEYMDKNDAYLHSQIGNPEGPDKPNKKKIDPRAWLHAGEKGMVARLVEAFENLGSRDRFEF
ncbi:MAG: class II fructose-bisphosphate aldolase [Spirochaetota bacterium]